MIISPPLLKAKDAHETDAAWIERVMTVVDRRGYPVNDYGSWHGGIHIRQTDEGRPAESVRAIADGTVVSLRKSSDKRDQAPFNINADKPNTKGSDDGYVLIKHETEIGSGDVAKVAFYSLYMHLKSLAETVKAGEKVYRKDPLGLPGMVDGVNAFHFQIFCDDDNISKLTGRKSGELDISKNGRTDAVYGDIHFYLPPQTKFYDKAPADNSTSITGLSELYTSNAPLYASMTLAQGNCTMVTRQKNTQVDGKYDLLGEPLVNADGNDYEYNLYKTAMRNYKESPSAGFELLRFGRVINTDHETLVPADAPLWMTVNYPGGKGVVNLADPSIKKFSDADFPHWTGWQMVDDASDSDSQCNSAIIKKLQEDGEFDNQCGKLICHFPFEWEKSTIDTRFSWLKTGSEEHDPMTEEDYAKFKAHAEALCFDIGELSSGSLWHFEPKAIINHFRNCGWLSFSEMKQIVPSHALRQSGRNRFAWEAVNTSLRTSGSILSSQISNLNSSMRKYCINTPFRVSCFLGNAIQETGWLSTLHEGNGSNLWYAPWYGRGFLQLTNPENYLNYFKYIGRTVEEQLKQSLVDAYASIAAQPPANRSNATLQDRHFPTLTTEFIELRNAVSDSHSTLAADSAGFYWVKNKMAKYADEEHVLERVSVNTNLGTKYYYRSPSFWEASAAVNLPGRIGSLYHHSLNGFDSRCCAYGVALAILTENKFPNASGNLVLNFPEGYKHRK
ncbi:M23 family metallopeptidase [Enterobacter quasiroggenkampii]|uniref:M23 family metallopeptidase n=1 Tax=Enterobacter TaxID=547 RepID=UPI001A22115D|nr:MULTISPECIES: M23 family metallopeptidase [Enterobacter]MBJ5870170.1 M23 family peptidase [Salmonella enterica subsp. enterica serovar Derby]MCB5948429.1 M23 family metallopeptidase [Enterobacter sp. TCD1-1]MCU6329197.1 M23 family metallopeptidase [Enterobacter quasiroggenkampii]MCU6337345.1 M23 family metallopeptidase [Enterobacter quasiroggenkampii]